MLLSRYSLTSEMVTNWEEGEGETEKNISSIIFKKLNIQETGRMDHAFGFLSVISAIVVGMFIKF